MSVALIDPLDPILRALRTIQSPHHIQANDNQDGYRVTSAAFIGGSDGTTSVDLEESMARAGLSITARYPHLDGSVALVSHRIEEYHANSFTVTHDPVEGNEHHGTVRTNLKNNPARRAARVMAALSEFVIPIDVDAARKFGAPPLINRKPI